MSNYRRGVDPRAIEHLIVAFIRKHPGTTTREVADHFGRFYKRSKTYGAHRNVAIVIAKLRKAGVLEDVARCPACKRALTRGRQNGPLNVRKDDQICPSK